MISIRRHHPADWAAVWPILRTAIASGDTLADAPGSSEAAIRAAWMERPAATYVAVGPDGRIVGVCLLKPNQPGLGSHVANCGYVVDPAARGRGVAAAMCEHSQAEALAQGYRAMQFNLVVASNEGAVRLWKRLGFAEVGRLPGAFRHGQLGFVDALVMFKTLSAPAGAVPGPADVAEADGERRR